MPSYTYIADKLNHWAYDEKTYFTVAELDEDIARSFHTFLSEHSEYIDGDLTIRAFNDSGIGTNFLLYDNKSQLYIADLTDYNSW